jgi:hypothetical protein
MSVKFEETIRKTTSGRTGMSVPESKHDFIHEVGEALTRGGGGPKGYLAAYLKQLQDNPLRTKMLTSGSLSGLQEFIASWIAHDRSKHGHYFTARVPKMALYGAFISAPLGHFLIWCLQKVFSGRTSLKAKIMQILVSNLIVAPIQNSVYLVSMAIIAGAKTFHQVRATVRAGFMPVMKVSWITSPIALAFAQKFLPEYTWVPFFNILAFIIGTYINAHTKKKRLAALRRKHYGDGRGGSDYRGDFSADIRGGGGRNDYGGGISGGISGDIRAGSRAGLGGDVSADIRSGSRGDYKGDYKGDVREEYRTDTRIGGREEY